MNKVDKITLKMTEYKKDLGSSFLDFNISGSQINYIITNTIRRVIMSDIPMYAFDQFKIEKNTAVLHNNYLKLRLRQMPVWSIDNKIDFFDDEIKTNTQHIIHEEENEEEDDVELDADKSLNSSSLGQLTMYLNFKNKTNNIVTVTTNDAKFYFDEKQIDSPYKTPIPIIKLHPGKELTFSAITKLGTETKDSMYSPVCRVKHTYKENDDTNIDFFLESRGQLQEKRILLVALNNIEKKMRNILKLFEAHESEDKSKDEELEGTFTVKNEDHTMGNLIKRGLQQHSNISFAGYNMPHPQSKTVVFHYKMKKQQKIKNIVMDVVNYYSELFEQIKKLVEKNIN